MVGLRRFFVWTLVFHVSSQKDITTGRYRRLTTDSELDDTKETLSGHEIHNKTIANDNELADKLFIPVITEQCERMGICEDVPNYPEEHVRAIVEAVRINGSRFVLTSASREYPPAIEYEDLCNTVEKIIAPKAAKNIHNEWQFVVNTKERPSQNFHVAVCRSLRAPCSKVTFPINYHAWCEQKHILIDMVAVNKHGQLIVEPHQLASYCACVYKRI